MFDYLRQLQQRTRDTLNVPPTRETAMTPKAKDDLLRAAKVAQYELTVLLLRPEIVTPQFRTNVKDTLELLKTSIAAAELQTPVDPES